MGGATVDELRRQAHWCVVVLRTVVVVVSGVAGVFQAPGDLVAVVVGGLCLWCLLYVRYAPRLWLLRADTLVIAGLCLAQGWLVRPEALIDITNWVFAVIVVTAVGHQWFTAPAGGALLTTVLVAAQLTGTAIAAPGPVLGPVPLGLTVFGAATLSRLLWFQLYAAAERADRAVAASETARRQLAVAAARRADEREHLAVLHDTAAATLLAVGTRMVEGTEPWLAEQAARDLDILAGQPGLGDDDTDLALLLDNLVAGTPVSVRLHVPHPLPMPSAPASAIGAAAREALTNVARHAGVDSADVVAARENATVVVEVTDRGSGFVRDEVPPHRRGVAESIEWRMAQVGGRAVVTSRPGGGTVVRLEWPVE